MLVLVFSTSVFAESGTLPENHVLIEDELFIDGQQVQTVFSVINGVVHELTIDEYLEIMSTNQQQIERQNQSLKSLDTLSVDYKDDRVSTKGMTDDIYRYNEILSTTQYRPDLTERVSAYSQNVNAYEFSHTFSVSATSREEFSISLGWEPKNAIRTGASFTWDRRHSGLEEFSMKLLAGQYGWFEYTPLQNYTSGSLITKDWLGNVKDTQGVYAYSARKLSSGLPDGLYQGITSWDVPND